MLSQDLEEAYYTLNNKFVALKAKLEDSYHTFENIIAHISDGLLFISQQGVITLFNSAASQLMSLNQKEVIDSHYSEWFEEELFGFMMSEALEEGSAHKRILLSLNVQEVTKEIEVSTSFVPQSGLIILLRDRTEVQRLEQTLQRNERLQALGEMAAALAHEIRNPLGGIEGFASLLASDLKEEREVSMARSIMEGTKNLNKLVTNVLEYARPIPLHFKPCEIGKVVEEVVAFFMAEGKPLEVIKKDDWIGSIDKEPFKRALFNLIRNAFEASDGQKVQLIVAKGKVIVRDEGCGLPQDHLEKIFTPFFTTKAKGTGLGLAEAHKVIHAHGGQLHVDSVLNEGSTFTIQLPIGENDAS